MEVGAASRERVEELLDVLEAEYGSVTVNQTTFAVGSTAYERAVERSREGRLAVHVVVHNDDRDVLLREADGGWAIPRGESRPGEPLAEAPERIVQETAGLDCSVEDAKRATISGVRNDDDPDADTVYTLSVVFTATASETGTAADSLRWADEAAVR